MHAAADDPRQSYSSVTRAWCLYDWANSAFAATIMAALFPPFYRSLVLAAGRGEDAATAYWGYTAAIALAVIAPLAPLLGAAADHSAAKKRFLAVFMGMGVIATAAFVFLGGGLWPAASVLFILANIGFAGANVFYDALLPHVAREDDMDRVSTRGYAMGYVGGGILLVINLAWYWSPRTFGMPDQAFAVKASFVSVAVWWCLFSIPLFRRVNEPPTTHVAGEGAGAIRAAFTRLVDTFRHLRRYRQALLFLAAFLIYNDGISTIIKMATAYGDAIGLELGHMVAALVITQFVGVPAAYAYGYLARWIGTKPAIMTGLVIYVFICLGAYWMKTAFHFYLLAGAVGLTQGGTQALSRSLFASIIPRSRSAEFFGFFSTSSKFAGILGPLAFALVAQIFSDARLAIGLITAFFVVGGALLAFVDVEEGKRAAGAAHP